jgi:hypothetical protein
MTLGSGLGFRASYTPEVDYSGWLPYGPDHWDFDPSAESQTRAEPKESDGIAPQSHCENGAYLQAFRKHGRRKSSP